MKCLLIWFSGVIRWRHFTLSFWFRTSQKDERTHCMTLNSTSLTSTVIFYMPSAYSHWRRLGSTQVLNSAWLPASPPPRGALRYRCRKESWWRSNGHPFHRDGTPAQKVLAPLYQLASWYINNFVDLNFDRQGNQMMMWFLQTGSGQQRNQRTWATVLLY